MLLFSQFCGPIDYSSSGYSVRGISQARILEWVATIPFSRESSQPRDQTHVSCIGRWILYHWATREAHLYNIVYQFSRSVASDSLQPHEPQHSRPPCPSPTPRVHSNLCPMSWWCHPTISSSVVPSPPALNLFQHQGLFQWVSSLHQVAQVLEFQLEHQSFQWIFRTDFL